MESLFDRSYLIRGLATTNDSSIRRWSGNLQSIGHQSAGQRSKIATTLPLLGTGKPAPNIVSTTFIRDAASSSVLKLVKLIT
jgi:hypothetical protein